MLLNIKAKSRKIISKSLQQKHSFNSNEKNFGVNEIHDNLLKVLSKSSNEVKKKQIEKYMKYTTSYRGINAPELTKIFRKFWQENSQNITEISSRKEIAELLLRSSFGEDKTIGMMIYHKIVKSIEEHYIQTVVKSFFLEKHIQDWAMCDSFCIKFLKHWAAISKENTLILAEWRNEENIWLKRASCVMFVTRARHGDSLPNFQGFIEILFLICEKVIKCQERFAQLGCGWLLREISLCEKEKTMEFLRKNIDKFSAEGLRYAVEKMSSSEAKQFIDLRKKLNKQS